MLQAIIGAVVPLLDKFIPDAGEKQALAHEIATMAQKMAHESALAQIEVNKEEAKSASAFVSGWRPFVGWTCGFALAYHFILQPLIVFGVTIAGVTFVPPVFDMNTLLTVLMGMLGLGGLRTFEKTKNIARK